MLEEYYYGHQWSGDSQAWDQRKYVINMFYPSIKISMPQAMFSVPSFTIEPKKTRTDDPASDAEAKAKLQEDTLNTVVSDVDFGFSLEAGLALLDAQFRFGIVEVGYSADFTENPLAGKPMLNDDQTEMMDETGKAVFNPDVVVNAEKVYMKWIPAKTFRVSMANHNNLEKCDWCGYYEYLNLDDVKANPAFKNTAGLTATARYRQNGGGDDEQPPPGMVKVWRIWDLRAKVKRTWADGATKFMQEKPFNFCPFGVLKFDEILGQFLPMPPTYNWVHPQNELNETRDMQKVHRRRFKRRFLRRAGAFKNEEEFRKLQSGEDGQSAEVTGDPTSAVVPLQDAPLDTQVVRNIPQTQDDFTRISGISGEAQQVAQSETATQANLIAMAGQVREAFKRVQVGQWCSRIGRLILMTMRENMALPFWIKSAVDPESPMAFQEAQEVAMLWKQIEAENLGDIDLEIDVELTAMSPAEQEQNRDKWIAFLQLLNQPGIGTLLLNSPLLLKKMAAFFGITSGRDLQQIGAAIEAVVKNAAMQQQQQAMGTMAKSSGGAAPGPTPNRGQTMDQLAQQMPMEMVQHGATS
jgi:hypothetical protein